MNYKRLALVLGIIIYLPVSVFLTHLIPNTDWPTAVIAGPMFGLVGGLFTYIVGVGLSFLWEWLREKPEGSASPPMSLERWHRLYDKGVDPDTHRCTNEWVKEGPTQSRWGCRPCMEVEREMAE